MKKKVKKNKKDVDYVEVALDLDDDFYDYSRGYDDGKKSEQRAMREMLENYNDIRRDLVENYLRYHKFKKGKK